MILECSDLERALRTPELMPDMRAHAEQCAACRQELYLWAEISRVAPGLHEEWESPFLWPRIQANLAAEPVRRGTPWLKWSMALAGVVALAAAMLQPWQAVKPANRELLTENALEEVQLAERAYARSIEKLSAVAVPKLKQSSSPLAAAYRAKLTLLDAGIAELKGAVAGNRYNSYLQMELASLYRQKQETLQEWLKDANHN